MHRIRNLRIRNSPSSLDHSESFILVCSQSKKPVLGMTTSMCAWSSPTWNDISINFSGSSQFHVPFFLCVNNKGTIEILNMAHTRELCVHLVSESRLSFFSREVILPFLLHPLMFKSILHLLLCVGWNKTITGSNPTEDLQCVLS